MNSKFCKGTLLNWPQRVSVTKSRSSHTSELEQRCPLPAFSRHHLLVTLYCHSYFMHINEHNRASELSWQSSSHELRCPPATTPLFDPYIDMLKVIVAKYRSGSVDHYLDRGAFSHKLVSQASSKEKGE